MTDPSQYRKVHIKRFTGEDNSGNKFSDVWVDMLRIDEIRTKHTDSRGNRSIRRAIIHWLDDLTDGDSDTDNPKRDVIVIKVCAPDDDPSNPSIFVKIPTIKKFVTKITDYTDTGIGTDQKKNNVFPQFDADTSSIPDTFDLAVVRVTHFDTNLDDNPAFDSGGVISLDQYQKIDGTEDTSNYLDVVIPKAYIAKTSHLSRVGQGTDTKKKRKFYNDYLIEMFQEPVDPPLVPPPFNPPWAFDPYQYVYNVSFGGLAVEFLDGAA